MQQVTEDTNPVNAAEDDYANQTVVHIISDQMKKIVLEEDREDQTVVEVPKTLDLNEYAKFEKEMVNQYGEEAFVKAYEVIKKNQDLIFSEIDGEEKVLMQIRNLFETDMTARGFISRCTTYLIMQNYSMGMLN